MFEENDFQKEIILQRLNRSGDYTLFLVKSLFILNSGAIIATLTFIGNNQSLIGSENVQNSQILFAIYLFVGGVCTSILSVFVFLSFLEFQMQRTAWATKNPVLGQVPPKVKYFTMFLAYGFGISSLVFFLFGAIIEAKAIL